MSDRLVAFYGDDLTGSVDVLLQFARAGRAGRLFVGLPDGAALAEAAATADVVGVAGIARSLPVSALDAEVRPAFEALGALRPAVVQYKACSTADSSPSIGSLGRVLEILREVFGERTVPMLFAQPDFGRYTVFGHHFAAEGGIVHRLDRQPTMSSHPSTPMTESDLVRHLGSQTGLPLAAAHFTSYADAEAIAERLRADVAGTVLDAFTAEHLALIGEALRMLAGERAPLAVLGSGGLSAALAGPWRAGSLPRSSALSGPVLAVSGSRSARTREQIAFAGQAGWSVRPLPLDDDRAALAEVVDELEGGRNVVLAAHGERIEGTGPQVLERLGAAAGRAALTALAAGATKRVVVCGGDTSGRVIRHLGVQSLCIAANPIDNVVLCTARSSLGHVDGVELLLKGGQVGSVDLLELVAGRLTDTDQAEKRSRHAVGSRGTS